MQIEALLWLLIIVIALFAFFAWVCSIFMLVDTYKKKGGPDIHGYPIGALWFVGLFASPMVLGLYVCALPGCSTELSESSSPAQIVDQLPSI